MATFAALAPLLGAGIQGASNFFGNLLGMNSQERINQQNLQFAWDMYGRQRKDALSDWTMQNEYNSPKAMMQRFQDANLNPNLIYGHGVTATAQVPRSSAIAQGNAQAFRPDFTGLGRSIGDGLQSFINLKMANAQTDQLAAQVAVAKEEAKLKQFQQGKTLVETGKIVKDTEAVGVGMESMKTAMESTRLDMEQKKGLFPFSLQAAEANVAKTRAEVDRTLQSILLEKLKVTQDVRLTLEQVFTEQAKRMNMQLERGEMMQRINAIMQDTEIKKLDRMLKAYDVDWKKAGVTSSDNFLFRGFAEGVKTLRDRMRNSTPPPAPIGNKSRAYSRDFFK